MWGIIKSVVGILQTALQWLNRRDLMNLGRRDENAKRIIHADEIRKEAERRVDDPDERQRVRDKYRRD